MGEYRPGSKYFRKAGRIVLRFVYAVAAATALVSVVGIWLTDVERPAPPAVVNDVTLLNPIAVDRVLAPTTTEEIVQAVREHHGPISIGGGRFSMGGQTATEGTLQLDMRQFNKVLDFSPMAKTIMVQAGATWRQILDTIDPFDLSIKVMQTYANFTVGGSLSVNVHGRYVGLGPLILSVRALKVVLADGTVVVAGPTQNSEIFFGVIGGYGGIGVITEATLELDDNVRVKRTNAVMPIAQYRQYFADNVRQSTSTVFHNADIYPDEYDTVNAVSYVATDEPVTVKERLIPAHDTYRFWHFLGWVVADWPFGKDVRQHLVDPMIYSGDQVEWRNYEASYDVAELPTSNDKAAYVLQEYFVPVGRFDEFIPKLRAILRERKVNMINISIRHAKADPGSLLAWAREEVFAFVMYYRQRTDAEARAHVGVWTRELIDAVLSVGGSYYLPYQPHATATQFLRAYPNAPDFFALKKRLDPENKFRNKLWDKYYDPRAGAPKRDLPGEARAALEAKPDYRRDEGQTVLTHPEWYIVYSSDEYAHYLKDHNATGFPYVRSIGQYWVNYKQAYDLTTGRYPFNWGYHTMLMVIGTSYSLELTLKALYENTLGRVTSWTLGDDLSDEDRYAQRVAEDYGNFIHVYPWYEYRFASKLGGLWSDVPLWGDHVLRKWERKAILSVEYAFKAVYASLISIGTKAAYSPEDDKMQLLVRNWSAARLTADDGARTLEKMDGDFALIATQRYDQFRDTMKRLAASDTPVEIEEIAGNDEIFLTGVAPQDWTYDGPPGQFINAMKLPTDETHKRVVVRLPVKELLPTLKRFDAAGALRVDHIYDY